MGAASARLVAGALLLASALLNAAGYLLNGYDRIAWYDELCHLFTMFAITASAGLIFLRRVTAARRLTGLSFAAVAVSAGAVLGISWEIFEYAIGIIGNAMDTAIDLALDVLGCMLGAVFAWEMQAGAARRR